MNGMITGKTVKNRIGRRKKEIHKGDGGRILIAAGSWGMTGSAILAARAALRAGAGLVRLAIPEVLFPIVQVGVPEATCVERNLSNLDFAAYDAICAGPGLGEGEESITLITKLLEEYEKTLLIDADGLNIIAHQDLFSLLLRRQERFPLRTVLTPHMGEAKRLLGDAFADIVRGTSSSAGQAAAKANRPQGRVGATDRQAASVPPWDINDSAVRQGIADALVAKTGAIVVLKGAGTIVAAPGMQAYTNTTGNPGMATGGSGDVLSGIITGLAGQRQQAAPHMRNSESAGSCDNASPQAATRNTDADLQATSPNDAARASSACLNTSTNDDAYTAEQSAGGSERMSAWNAAICGVYIHGLAGDLAAQELGEYGVTAGDLAQYTAYAIKLICEA